MTRMLRTLYFAALTAWKLFSILSPPWTGRMYNRYEPWGWHQAGAFGLSGADGWTLRAPLLSPPVPHSGAIEAAVRWP